MRLHECPPLEILPHRRPGSEAETPETVRCITEETATIRNRVVAEVSSAVVVAHAAPGNTMEALCHDIRAAAKPLYTFDHPANAALLDAGARTVSTLSIEG